MVSALYISYGVLTWERAKESVSADVLFIIAAAFGLGNALQDTGAASVIAQRSVGEFVCM
jgi:di/tricarboxylate transporter